LLEQPDGVLLIKAAQIGLPAAHDLGDQFLDVIAAVGVPA
jgi:hypothetical protein